MNPEELKHKYLKALVSMLDSINPQDRRTALVELGKIGRNTDYKYGYLSDDNLEVMVKVLNKQADAHNLNAVIEEIFDFVNEGKTTDEIGKIIGYPLNTSLLS